MRKSLMILVLAALATSTLLAANASIGTWKYNAAKSKFSPGPPYKSRTVKVEPHGEGIKVTVEGVSGDGSKHGYSYTAGFDGKDNPVTGNSPFGDTVALTRVDPHTTRSIVKRGGKEVATQTTTVSADGKTRTTTTKGTDAKGQKIDSVSFYEKQ